MHSELLFVFAVFDVYKCSQMDWSIWNFHRHKSKSSYQLDRSNFQALGKHLEVRSYHSH